MENLDLSFVGPDVVVWIHARLSAVIFWLDGFGLPVAILRIHLSSGEFRRQMNSYSSPEKSIRPKFEDSELRVAISKA